MLATSSTDVTHKKFIIYRNNKSKKIINSFRNKTGCRLYGTKYGNEKQKHRIGIQIEKYITVGVAVLGDPQ